MNTYEDRLIGVIITTEHLDLIDFEGNPNNDSNNAQSRIYATFVSKTHVNEETGAEILTHEYVFESIDGIQFCVPTIKATEEKDGYVATMSDLAISDAHVNLHYSDDENRVAIEGTVFITSSIKENTYYFIPIY
ncbi:MAG: hypothetical protein FWD45_02360 [Coriobacteriia bacterium]|nr:hypothetical protein [Coriobacteriia bacterium]